MTSHARRDWPRRAVLGGLAAIPFAGPARAELDHVSFEVPDGACDCHHHLYDPRWAYAPTAVIKPPPATLADYRRYQARLEPPALAHILGGQAFAPPALPALRQILERAAFTIESAESLE